MGTYPEYSGAVLRDAPDNFFVQTVWIIRVGFVMEELLFSSINLVDSATIGPDPEIS